jgi:hypothetical protein
MGESKHVSKAELLKKRFGEEEVEVPGVGTVRVRALTRGQALELQGKEMPVSEMERRLISTAMVEPSLTEDEVQQWQDNTPAGELQPVVEAIARLSGMEQHAGKAAYQQFRG